MKLRCCRFCNNPLTKSFVDLGLSPLANSLIDKNSLKSKEPFYPLHAFVCDQCFLVQLEEFESPENIFSDYVYFSSYSESWVKHAEDYVEMMMRKFGFNENTQVIEIASNDGYLLQFFKKKDIPVLGIEPAINIAKVAEEKGIPTMIKFFGVDTAKELLLLGKQADLLLGNNVLAHVPDLNDFVSAMKIILKKDGIITMEFPHLLRLMLENQFDTIYHEHFSYFSLFVVQKIFLHHGLSISDVDELSTHGGSLRIYARHESDNYPIQQNVKNILDMEEKFGLKEIPTYLNFQSKIDKVRHDLRDFLITTKSKDKKVVCYGAPAKGNTLLNYCGITPDLIEYTVDRSPYKQGLYLPGTHIPIKHPDVIKKTKPDYLLILPWNLKDEIISQMNYIRNWDGKFVIPIPEVKVIP